MIKMKNILAENMLRFGPRNLSESERKNLQKLSEAEPGDPSQAVIDLQPLVDKLKNHLIQFNNALADKNALGAQLGLSVSYANSQGTGAGDMDVINVTTSPVYNSTAGKRGIYGFMGINLATGQLMATKGTAMFGVPTPISTLNEQEVSSRIIWACKIDTKWSKWTSEKWLKHTPVITQIAKDYWPYVETLFKDMQKLLEKGQKYQLTSDQNSNWLAKKVS